MMMRIIFLCGTTSFDVVIVAYKTLFLAFFLFLAFMVVSLVEPLNVIWLRTRYKVYPSFIYK